MSSAYYELYLKGVLDLVSTMVVKSEVSAWTINNWLKARLFTVDESAPKTWKYYLNLAGKYHHTDTPMTVTSLDTLEEIPFTTESLLIHRSTRREYTYRSRYYSELVKRYPDQVELILGILNPIDLDTVVNAKDHTILYYDKTLVEDGEIDLIPRLQDWINSIYVRWDVPDYSYTESLYTASQMALMFALMPKQIINIRLDNCKTDRAHSFHIRQYLTSFGRLDPYVDYLNRKQRLFFYRNIRYLNLNSGKAETFDLLTQKVMTDRFFPLAEYTIRHNNETQAEDLYPVVEMRRSSINGLDSALGADVKTVADVLDMQQALARANTETQPQSEVQIPQQMKNSLSSQLETKVLESNVLDKADAEPFTLTDVVFNHWIYLSANNKYTTIFTVTSPNTGEDMYLSAKEMFILWLYVYNKARGVRLDIVPNIIAKRVKRNTLPTFSELRWITEKKYVSDAYIRAALDNQPVIKSYISVDAFKEACTSIHRASMAHRDLTVYNTHMTARGQLEQMTDRFYMDRMVNLADEQPYDAWLKAQSLDLDVISDIDLDILATTIYSAATGQDLTVIKSLQDIHSAHVRLMGQLSSYSVQFIQQINTSALKVEDWSYLRMGDHDSLVFDHTRVKLYLDNIQKFDVTGKPAYFKTFPRVDSYNDTLYTSDYVYNDITLQTDLLGGGNAYYQQKLTVIDNHILEVEPFDLSTVEPNETLVGYEGVETVALEDIFSATSTDLYSPLSPLEKNIMLTRTTQ
jgi:hypothetical protein